MQIVVISVLADRNRAEKVASEAGEAARVIPPGLSLIEVSAVISHFNLLISPDTSLIHIARSFQVPVVGLYNLATKNFRRWQPYRQPDGAVLGTDIDTISDITVDQVYDRVRQVLERVETKSS